MPGRAAGPESPQLRDDASVFGAPAQEKEEQKEAGRAEESIGIGTGGDRIRVRGYSSYNAVY